MHVWAGTVGEPLGYHAGTIELSSIMFAGQKEFQLAVHAKVFRRTWIIASHRAISIIQCSDALRSLNVFAVLKRKPSNASFSNSKHMEYQSE